MFLRNYRQIFTQMKSIIISLSVLIVCILSHFPAKSQIQNQETKQYKNIVRYNLSGSLIFGFNEYVIAGYERIIKKNQSVSINIGLASLPKFIGFKTDSVNILKDIKNTGVNISADYRFYLAKENKYAAPHGIYIGPYYSFNKFYRSNEFSIKQSSAPDESAIAQTSFSIHSLGAELGYQFVFWKRLTVDVVAVGPGISNYKIHAKFKGTLNEGEHKRLREAIVQVIKKKFPGMDHLLTDQQLNANGILNTWNIGFRYLVHIGFAF